MVDIANTKWTEGAPNSSQCSFGPELAWLWDMRAALFTRIDEGIQFDEVGLIGAKLESAALRCAERLSGSTALDVFAGIGGSAIALARSGKTVISMELDATRLRMARHNANIYGVGDRITFLQADARSILGTFRVDSIYLDPPWGGVEAAERPCFTLADFRPCAQPLLETALATAASVAICVPPNFDFGELKCFQPDVVEPVVHRGEVLYYDVFFLR